MSIFKSFKIAFRSYRDRWTVANKGRGAKKEELAKWVAMALRKALTEGRIQKGFAAIGIWPLRPSAMELFMQPSSCYVETAMESETDTANEEESADEHAESASECIPETQPAQQQYFVDAESGSDGPCSGSTDSEGEATPTPSRRSLFELLQVERPHPRRRQEGEPLIDYSKSILMTSDVYIAAMAAKVAKKESVAKEQEELKKLAEERKAQREEEKSCKEAEKLLCRI